ncbi:uncharacterized protein SCDLUD_001316 [Saccharomycodes ludwigii]|uniref:uncharacterized protein n=1 Tax=Saccharomycodes ludwigii TaxID=36035 RepID=UPI001E88F6C5|nr:hypothetical protein SCDLUD_001316 [Saccharomycodes ludwigii]KAH3903667.1 hypothetical protein SCDLUD_001316 [Saccharomycodes ludwigii]
MSNNNQPINRYELVENEEAYCLIPTGSEYGSNTKKGVKNDKGNNIVYKNIPIVQEHSNDLFFQDSDSDTDKQNIVKLNPFADPTVAEYYRKIYKNADYEGLLHFEPEFNWSKNEEDVLLKKLNHRVALVACFLFAALQIDRGNLKQAISDNLLEDLGMNTNDYNHANTIFLLCFLLAEIPSQLLSKKIGPEIWIPIQMILWSFVSVCQATIHSKRGFLITRALIGSLEGGFVSDLILWLSYFFTAKELTVRLSWFWATLSVVQISTAFLAFGILRMRGIWGLEGWKWLFIIEGIMSGFIGIISFQLMVPSAVQTKSWLEPNGWFTEREEKIIVNRLLRDDPSKGDINNKQPLSLKDIWQVLIDYDLWPIYIIGLMAYIPIDTFDPYFTLTLQNLGFSKFNIQLLTIPANVLHIIFLLIITSVSEKFNEVSMICLFAPIYTTIVLGIIRWWPGSMIQIWPSYILCVLFVGQPYIHAICVSWVSRNSNSIKTRAISAALYNMFVQLANIVATNIYRDDDKPKYNRGNYQLFHISWLLIPILLLTKAYYIFRNKQKGKSWNAMTPEQREDYIYNSTDIGCKRLDFRFIH